MDPVAAGLSELIANGFPRADDTADRSVRVFYTHVDDAPVIGNTVEFRMDLQPSRSVSFANIPRKTRIRAAVRLRVQNGVVFAAIRYAYFPSGKLVNKLCSTVGRPYRSFASAIARIRNAMFLARLRMVCSPSRSFFTSSAVNPCT